MKKCVIALWGVILSLLMGVYHAFFDEPIDSDLNKIKEEDDEAQ